MNQIDSFKNGRRSHFEPVKLIGNSDFEHCKAVMSYNNMKTKNWSSGAATAASIHHESNSSPLFVKSISQNFKNKNKFNIQFLKDSDQISAKQSRFTVYDSIINHGKIQNSNINFKSTDFITTSSAPTTTTTTNESSFNLATNNSNIIPSRKHKSKSASNYHFMPSSASSNNSLKLKITNLTIKHATIDMSDQCLAMIPDNSNGENNHHSYIFGDKAKLIAKLIEKSSNLTEDKCCSSCKKKSIDSGSLNHHSKLSIQNLYLDVDLEKSLRINDDLNESSLNNPSNVTWNGTGSLFMKSSHSKYNTKLDRQFKKVVPNANTASPPTVAVTSKSRIKSSSSKMNESVHANHYQAIKSSQTDMSSSRNSQNSIVPGSVNGISIKLKFPNLNKDNLSENISLNNEYNINKIGFETNQFTTTSLFEFSTGKT